MNFQTKNIIYIPTYNHSATIYNLLDGLKKVNFDFDVLVIDDSSKDNTLLEIKKFLKQSGCHFNINVIKTKINSGYAISVKIAFSIFLNLTNCENIIVLHGDGQYEPILINNFLPFIKKDFAIVQGWRSKKLYPKEDQTPFLAYITIKILNYYENIICNTKFNEWHSGFAMYKRNFLSKIFLHNLTNTMHIDGNLLYLSKLLSQKVYSVKIYKKYNNKMNYNYFSMIKYVFSVLFFPFFFIINNKKYYLEKKLKIKYDYEIIKI